MGYESGHSLLFIDLQPAIERVWVPRLQQPLARHGVRALAWSNLS
jgi:hypothetical protein